MPARPDGDTRPAVRFKESKGHGDPAGTSKVGGGKAGPRSFARQTGSIRTVDIAEHAVAAGIEGFIVDMPTFLVPDASKKLPLDARLAAIIMRLMPLVPLGKRITVCTDSLATDISKRHESP